MIHSNLKSSKIVTDESVSPTWKSPVFVVFRDVTSSDVVAGFKVIAGNSHYNHYMCPELCKFIFSWLSGGWAFMLLDAVATCWRVNLCTGHSATFWPQNSWGDGLKTVCCVAAAMAEEPDKWLSEDAIISAVCTLCHLWLHLISHLILLMKCRKTGVNMSRPFQLCLFRVIRLIFSNSYLLILFDLRLTVKRASSGKLKRRFEDTVQICIEDIAQLCVGAQTFFAYFTTP